MADLESTRVPYSVEIAYQNAAYYDYGFQNVIKGQIPQEKDEIAIDKDTLAAMGNNKNVGEKIVLNLKSNEGIETKEFVLSGILQSNDAMDVKTGFITTSSEFMNSWLKNHKRDKVYGQVAIGVVLKNINNIEKDALRILKEIGCSAEETEYSINPVYEGAFIRIDVKEGVAIICLLFIIGLTGYLLIYNIFSMMISAAGGHNVLLKGTPGCGKTMLARRLPTIMPPMNHEEMVEVTTVYSVSGLLTDSQQIITTRPFRTPHQGITIPAMLGGGARPVPGEFSLAHHGVLFTAESPLSKRRIIENGKGTAETRAFAAQD